MNSVERSLSGFEPTALPQKSRRKGGLYAKFVGDFLASGDECWGKECEGEKEMLRLANGLASAIKSHYKDKAYASIRDGAVYIVRMDDVD